MEVLHWFRYCYIFIHALCFSFSFKFSPTKGHLEPCRYCKAFFFFFFFYPWCAGSLWRILMAVQGSGQGRKTSFLTATLIQVRSDGGLVWPGWKMVEMVRMVGIIYLVCMCAHSCPILGDFMDSRLPGSSVQGIFRQGYWSRLPYPPPIYLEAALNELIDRPDVFGK